VLALVTPTRAGSALADRGRYSRRRFWSTIRNEATAWGCRPVQHAGYRTFAVRLL